MKTRLQLVKGYIAGTLSAEEEEVVKGNPVVLAEIARQQAGKYEGEKIATITSKQRKGKHVGLEAS